MRYEIREMSFGEILDTGFQLLRNHFSLLVGMSLVLYAPVAVLSILMATSTQTGEAPSLAVAIFGMLPLGLAILIVAPIVSAANTYAIGKLYLGERVEFRDAWQTAVSLMLPLVGTSLLSMFAVGVGLLLLIVPGIYLMLAFILLWQVMVLERVFGVASLRRSHELMKGNKGRALGILFISGVVVAVLSTALQLLFSVVPLLGPIGSAAAQAVGNVYTTAISVVLYFDIRCRKEAFDLEHLARLVQGRTAEPGGALAP